MINMNNLKGLYMEQLSLFDTLPTKENSTTILLSLQNEYFDKMLEGTKHYEYRFAFPKTSVNAYIYAPKKIKSIIGYVELAKPIEGTAEEISKLYASCGDGDYDVMFDYIGNHKKTYAMKIKKVIKFEKDLPYKQLKSMFPDFYAPQSYIILDKTPDLLNYIKSCLSDQNSTGE